MLTFNTVKNITLSHPNCVLSHILQIGELGTHYIAVSILAGEFNDSKIFWAYVYFTVPVESPD